eukprot:9490502-Lingulodinium_polyedra.AAC.1
MRAALGGPVFAPVQAEFCGLVLARPFRAARARRSTTEQSHRRTVPSCEVGCGWPGCRGSCG